MERVQFFPQVFGHIDSDKSRYRQIVKGAVRGDLGKHVSSGEMIGKRKGDTVSIPVPQIELPSFRFGKTGGVGQGEGNVGGIYGIDGDEGGEGAPGSEAGQHMLEVEVDLLVELMKEQVELKNLLPLGKGNIHERELRMRSIQIAATPRLDPKRSIRMGMQKGLDLEEAIALMKVPPAARYRSFEEKLLPKAQAVTIYMMDVSGSMTDRLKTLARKTASSIDLLVQSEYPKVERCFIVHDAAAQEVDEEAFYHTRQSGGTVISSAYELATKVIETRYPPTEWNVFLTQFSDGENFASDDQKCYEILRDKLLPGSRFFAFVETHNENRSQDAIRFVGAISNAQSAVPTLEGEQRFVAVEVANDDAVWPAVRDIIGKKKG